MYLTTLPTSISTKDLLLNYFSAENLCKVVTKFNYQITLCTFICHKYISNSNNFPKSYSQTYISVIHLYSICTPKNTLSTLNNFILPTSPFSHTNIKPYYSWYYKRNANLHSVFESRFYPVTKNIIHLTLCTNILTWRM